MKQKLHLLVTTAALGFALQINAASIYTESFDYGSSDLNQNSFGSWSGGGSSLFIYDADGGLDVSTMNGETGGAITMTASTSNNEASDGTPNYAMSNLVAGDEFWVAALFDFASGSEGGVGLTLNSGDVSGLGFSIGSTGGVSLFASDDGGADGNISTGQTVGVGTHLLVVRGTKGSGTSPENSTVDFWLNPTTPGSVAGLGTATFSTGADSKFGRDTDTFGSLKASLATGHSIDEIRVGTSFSDLSLVPEASTALLLGLAGSLFLLRRRR